MIRKADYIVAAWIALMVKKHGDSSRFTLKDILFRKSEIKEEAETIAPVDKRITDADFDNLVVGRGTGSDKCFVPGKAGTLQEYVFLILPDDETKETCIDLILRTSMDFPRSCSEARIRRTLEEYHSFICHFPWPEQREYPGLRARDALWLAAAALTYNDRIRDTKPDENGNYCYRQRTIAAAAVSLNRENGLMTCQQMARKDCTCGKSSQGYTYFTAEGQLRRLTRSGEQPDTIPDLSDEYEVMTIDGMKTAKFLKDFVRTVYSGDAPAAEQPLDVKAPIREQEMHATRLDTRTLFRAAMQRSQMEITSRTVSVNQYYRDPYIAQYAKRKADGKCQLCQNDAPFINNDGEPYLEAHHIHWLSAGGKDTLKNVVALCPNCHRKMHQLNLQEDRERLMEIAERYGEE